MGFPGIFGHAGDDEGGGGGQLSIEYDFKHEGIRFGADAGWLDGDGDLGAVEEGEQVVGFDVDAGIGETAGSGGEIGQADGAEELVFGALGVAEEGGVVDAATGVGVDEANAGVPDERLGGGHGFIMRGGLDMGLDFA